jgi:ABC-type sugar transport system substrate-binding protein
MAFIPYISELQRLVATTAVLAAAAFTASSTHAADESKGKKVLLLESFTAHPYVATTEKSFRERALSYGMEVTVQAAGLDAALQARQADDGIARKFDLIVIQPISEQGIVPVLTRAKQAGIPVIIVNNTPKDGTEELYVTFVGQDQNEMGRIAGKVALITGALQQGPGPRRVAGFKEVVAANPKLEIAAIEDGRWDTATSERLAGQLYARFAASGGLDAVYGMADNQAVAAIKAADAAGITVGTGPKQLIVVGGNCQKEGLDAIGAGKMYSSVTQIPTDLGRRTADAANEFFAGKKLPKADLLPADLITKANLAQWQAPCTY